jgi:hypothetical protein
VESRTLFRRIGSEFRDIVVGLLALPFILILLAAVPMVALVSKLTGWGSTTPLSKADVAKYLEDFVNNEGGDWDWDDFTSIPIKDPELDKVRQFCEEARLRWPAPDGRGWCSDEGLAQIRALAAQLRAEVDAESSAIAAPAPQP